MTRNRKTEKIIWTKNRQIGTDKLYLDSGLLCVILKCIVAIKSHNSQTRKFPQCPAKFNADDQSPDQMIHTNKPVSTLVWDVARKSLYNMYAKCNPDEVIPPDPT